MYHSSSWRVVLPGHSAEARADWTAASIHSSAHSNVGNPMDTVFKNHPFGVYPRYTETALIFVGLLESISQKLDATFIYQSNDVTNRPVARSKANISGQHWTTLQHKPEVKHARKEKKWPKQSLNLVVRGGKQLQRFLDRELQC